jgi:hypothetical protein
MVTVSDLVEKDDSSITVTVVLSSEAVERIKAGMNRFHKTNSFCDEIKNLLTFAIVRISRFS